MEYRNFDIRIDPPRDGVHPVQVLASPAGQGTGCFRFPLPLAELRAFLTMLGRRGGVNAQQTSGTERNVIRLAGESAQLSPRRIGGALFEALFTDQIRRLYDRSQGSLQGESAQGLRIRLHFDPMHPSLAPVSTLPWEFLYESETQEFLALRRAVAIVRFLAVPRPTTPLHLRPPLRILAVLANPRGSAPLGLLRERRLIEDACGSRDLLEVRFLPQATPSALRKALLSGRFHVLHFMGHGSFDVQTGRGALLFERDDGEPDPLPAEVLARLLQDASDLRLAVLNACETAVTTTQIESGLNPFAGVATALVMAALPAVVAMQFPVSDSAAIAFSSTFYSRLAEGDPLEAAVAEARLAVHSAAPGSPEWGTPVLFLRNQDGRLFKMEEPLTAERPSLAAQLAPSTQAESASGERLDFTQLIADKSRDFVGRRFVFEALDRFISTHPCGYFLVSGEPGIGKTAVLAEMVRTAGYTHYFHRPGGAERRRELFLRNVSAQLAERYRLRCNPSLVEKHGQEYFLDWLLSEVAERLPPGSCEVILVDLLDETANLGSAEPYRLVLPERLPVGIFFVATSGRSSQLRPSCKHEVLDLDPSSCSNLSDLQEFVARQLSRTDLSSCCKSWRLSTESLAARLVDRSCGNFQYARYVLSELGCGAYQDQPIETLPLGLQGYYESFWHRLRTRHEESFWTNQLLPAVMALAVTGEPLSAMQIADLAGLGDRRHLRQVLHGWEPCLRPEEGAEEMLYWFAHSTFENFVASRAEHPQDRAMMTMIRLQITERLWSRLGDRRSTSPA